MRTSVEDRGTIGRRESISGCRAACSLNTPPCSPTRTALLDLDEDSLATWMWSPSTYGAGYSHPNLSAAIASLHRPTPSDRARRASRPRSCSLDRPLLGRLTWHTLRSEVLLERLAKLSHWIACLAGSHDHNAPHRRYATADSPVALRGGHRDERRKPHSGAVRSFVDHGTHHTTGLGTPGPSPRCSIDGTTARRHDGTDSTDSTDCYPSHRSQTLPISPFA